MPTARSTAEDRANAVFARKEATSRIKGPHRDVGRSERPAPVGSSGFVISGLGSSFPVSTQAEDTQAKLSWASSPTAWEPGHCFPESVCPLVLGRCPSGAPRAGRQKGLPEPLPIRAGRTQGLVFLAELQDRQTRDWLRLQATRVAPAPWAPRPSASQQTSRPRTTTPWPSPFRPLRSRTSAPQAACSPPWRRDAAGSASTGCGCR